MCERQYIGVVTSLYKQQEQPIAQFMVKNEGHVIASKI